MIAVQRKALNLFRKTCQIYRERGSFVAMQQVLYRLYQSHRKNSISRTVRQWLFLTDHFRQLDLQNDVVRLLENGLLLGKSETQAALTSLPDAAQKDIIAAADELLDGTYTLYGALKVHFDAEFSWHLDPLTRYLWPIESTSAQVATRKPDGVDIKTIWEISRFQFLCPLAYAYLLSGEKRYADFALDKLISWIDANPQFSGPHWTRAMEASIRLINCITYLPLLASSLTGNKRDVFISSLTSFIVEHVAYIYTNPEYTPAIRNNHYLANQVGLIAGGNIFQGKKWFNKTSEKARQRFFDEILLQFRADGINFEGSLPYHRLSAEIAALGFILLNKTGVEIPKAVLGRLQSIVLFTNEYTTLSSDTPVLGDNDSGIFLKYFLGQESSSHFYLNGLLSIASSPAHCGQEYFADLITTAQHSDPVKSFPVSLNPSRPDNCVSTAKGSQVTIYDGLMIARHNNNGIMLNSLNNGMWGSGGHTHNDKLSVYPVIEGKYLFLDRGSFSYTGFSNKRMLDRSALSHNGPVLNGCEQNLYDKNDAFHIWGNAVCGRKVQEGTEELCMQGWYDTTLQVQKVKMRVCRKVVWNISSQIVTIIDWFENGQYNKEAELSWKFLINPYWSCSLHDNVLTLYDRYQSLSFVAPERACVDLSIDSYAPHYQVEKECWAFNISLNATKKERISFTINY